MAREFGCRVVFRHRRSVQRCCCQILALLASELASNRPKCLSSFHLWWRPELCHRSFQRIFCCKHELHGAVYLRPSLAFRFYCCRRLGGEPIFEFLSMNLSCETVRLSESVNSAMIFGSIDDTKVRETLFCLKKKKNGCLAELSLEKNSKMKGNLRFIIPTFRKSVVRRIVICHSFINFGTEYDIQVARVVVRKIRGAWRWNCYNNVEFGNHWALWAKMIDILFRSLFLGNFLSKIGYIITQMILLAFPAVESINATQTVRR